MATPFKTELQRAVIGSGMAASERKALTAIIEAIPNPEDLVPEIDPNSLYGGRLLYGSVTWLSGLTFDVSAASFVIDSVVYFSDPDQVTLDAADATHPRIDVIYVDTDGLVGFIAGTPAADPAKPEIDPDTQLELTFVTIAALATTPENIDVVLIYGEDAGDPTEWDATETTSAARIDLDNTEEPYAGTKAIKFMAAATNDRVDLDAASSAISVGDIDSLEMHIRPEIMANNRQIRVAFYLGNSRASAWVQVKNGNFGFDSSNNVYQTVDIPGQSFSFNESAVDQVRFQIKGNGSPVTAYLDQIRVQTGGGTTIINITQGLTESELVNNVRRFNAQQHFGNDTLVDAATVDWDLDVSPIAEVTLDGNRTLDIANIRAGGTYILFVTQDDTTGSRLMTWDAAIQWAGGTAPTLSTEVDSVDMFTFVAKSDTVLFGVAGGLDFS